jgi:UDP-N-acetylmuramyl pentapeptide phosphotransferase/UDP-N-acetylglucosamine-1-phosphate transferase
VAAFVLTPVFSILGRRLGYLDVPGQRSSHSVPTPRTGGFAIFAAIVIPMFFYWNELASLCAGVSAVVLLAALDDLRSLDRRLRLICQCLIAGAVLWAMLGSRSPQNPETFVLLSGLLGAFLGLLWLVTMINAYNFMDGINGIAAAQAVIGGLALTVLFVGVGDEGGAVASVAAAAAGIGFLPWNFPRAAVFMGDVGSTALGLLFGALVLRVAADGVPLIAAALPFAPFVLDSGATIALRAYRREAFFSMPHRLHFYQRLVTGGWSHASVTLTWSLLALACSLVAVAYGTLTPELRLISAALLVFVHLVIGAAISMRWPLTPSEARRRG